MTDAKTICSVPGCGRWTRRLRPGSEYLCPGCFKRVPPRLKRAYRARVRQLKALGDEAPHGLYRRADALWRRQVRFATLAAAGLA